MKRKLIIGGATLIILVGVIMAFGDSEQGDGGDILVEVENGDFLIEITVSGELEAKNSVEILGPSGLRAAGLWQVKIENLVSEGTVVEKGDYIASLDKSELADKIKSAETELQQRMSAYTQTRLDTALELRQARDELINLEFDVEEKKLVLQQSQFEPPATIKQAEIDLERSKRKLDQAKQNYRLKTEKGEAQMQEAAARMAEFRNEYDFLNNLAEQLTIKAPEAGMVIYTREYNGTKRAAGSTLNAWNPTVATLPDLTTMLSKTYVNEVDIRKVKKGQSVKIGLDAFPDKNLTGKVTQVANVGEQKPNSEAKVFEVSIQVNESDTTLRPAMTTSNTILAERLENVNFLPLECLHTQGDSLIYVYKKEGLSIYKQEVEVGKSNADKVVITRGLSETDKVFLSVPANFEDKKLVRLAASTTNLSVR